jgi:TorA maturation chaperone TorD/formate hydrogenlyase subunit 6/NADH:ubiquinone oxidoreductase subunit I
MDASTAQARSRIYAALAQDFARPQEGLETEYARLFVGPGRPVAHPYESVYREGWVMGDCTLAVRQSYAVEGLAPEGHSLPDHVALELEFMAHLGRREAEAREQGDEEEALICLRQQEAFLGEHLGRWLPRFCQQVLAGEAHPFYASLAQRTWEHVAQDMAQVRAWLNAAEPVDERGRWTVAVGSECTLCGLCARLCQQETLRLTQDEGEVCLLFDPAPCNGCAACQQWCPEGAVTIELSPSAEGQRVLTRSPLVTCPGCGRPYLSAALLAKVREQTGGEDECLQRRLALCPACKASPPISSFVKED